MIRVCPACGSGLTKAPGGFECETCQEGYEDLGGVECLVRQPRAYCARWVARLERYGALTRAQSAVLMEQARAAGTTALRRERLVRLARGLEVEYSVLSSLFSPLKGNAEGGSQGNVLEALVDDPLAVSRYSEHLFRDWCWGQAENARTFGLMASLFPEGCGSVAVLGAGTGRLALELLESGYAREVYALDLNPLPLLVADHLLGGASLTLPEFPQFPVSSESVVVYRELKHERARPPGLHLVLADALHAPFVPGSFDAVLTPWFIDDVGAEVRDTIAAVNRLLAPGGTWVNVGPLQFATSAARACSLEEVQEIAAQCGLAPGPASVHDLPYFESPVSGTRRIDRTYAFGARKVAEMPAKVEQAGSSRGESPIPVTSRLQGALQQAVLTAGIASLVDGHRSIRDLALVLARDWRVDPDELMGPLSDFVARLI